MVALKECREYLFYRRPDCVPPASSDGSVMESKSDTTRSSAISIRGIPERLTFDKIINHETCPPCTTLDFYYYLNYKVHCAENLQFYLWLRDYTHRYNSPALLKKTAEQPVWTAALQDDALQKFQRDTTKKTPMSATVRQVFKGTMFSNDFKPRERGNPNAPPPTGTITASTLIGAGAIAPWEVLESKGEEDGSQSNGDPVNTEDRKAAISRVAYEKHGLHYPFFQNREYFRPELETIITTYIAENSPRQLNLSAAERYAVLSALQTTASPSAFQFVSQSVESSLRIQHHPNFILDAICNGNRPRVIFARGLGAALIVLGLVIAMVLSMSAAPRRWRWFCMLLWVLGISTSVAAWKGMCVVLHGLHHRHVRPWEMFQTASNSVNSPNTSSSPDTELCRPSDDPLNPRSTSRNDATTQYWTERYARRNIVRKIFDREVWIQEPALRQVQDQIFIQALLFAVLGSAAITCVWVFAVPKGGLF
ncbi:hypothetical protein BJ878DRAFT_516957 [Calycina marina]|uniref:RGS domain-containing protein n=1 Tax=Calycina marina TaxID=1763456 RepID=A0A9P7YZQ7_9HELO|nr:hypothetical protein BJ878DRAFT_516957 [Calycina marina]